MVNNAQSYSIVAAMGSFYKYINYDYSIVPGLSRLNQDNGISDESLPMTRVL